MGIGWWATASSLLTVFGWPQVTGRSAELARVCQILSRRKKSNPLLLGEPGVGKTAVAEGLAYIIAKRINVSGAPLPTHLQARLHLLLETSQVQSVVVQDSTRCSFCACFGCCNRLLGARHSVLEGFGLCDGPRMRWAREYCMQDAKVLSLDISLLLAGAKERGELESRLKKLISEISSSRTPIILFIDELHTAVGTGMPLVYLQYPISTLNYCSLHRHIHNSGFLR